MRQTVCSAHAALSGAVRPLTLAPHACSAAGWAGLANQVLARGQAALGALAGDVADQQGQRARAKVGWLARRQAQLAARHACVLGIPAACVKLCGGSWA